MPRYDYPNHRAHAPVGIDTQKYAQSVSDIFLSCAEDATKANTSVAKSIGGRLITEEKEVQILDTYTKMLLTIKSYADCLTAIRVFLKEIDDNSRNGNGRNTQRTDYTPGEMFNCVKNLFQSTRESFSPIHEAAKGHRWSFLNFEAAASSISDYDSKVTGVLAQQRFETTRHSRTSYTFH